MRWQFVSLPWETLGPRLVMLSLTYPGDWRRWVPDGETLEAHRRAFVERWRRRWHAPKGVWIKEFQQSGRPHLHIYLAVPDEVPAEEYEGLRQRTLLRHRLERKYGRYEGRAKLPAIGLEYGGDFAMWLRTAWSEIVGTQGVDRRHHARGVDVAVSFWTDEVAQTKDRVEVAQYLAGESAKWAQKAAPGDFRVGRYYGVLGRKQGFKPVETEVPLSDEVAYEVERRLDRLVRWRMRASRARYGQAGPSRFELRREGNGVTAFRVRPADVEKLLTRCEKAAARRALARGSDRPFVWGPSYRGTAVNELGEISEDTDEWERDRAEWGELVKRCGCSQDDFCLDCVPAQVRRRMVAGCGCRGDEFCIACVDPQWVPSKYRHLLL